MMPKWSEWRATYRVVTPMFCAGADPQKPELRAASFKGVLRFWWRALAWGWYNGDLTKICEAEEYIFGGVSQGQSKVRVQLRPCGPQPTGLQSWDPAQAGLIYLAGMGLVKFRKQPQPGVPSSNDLRFSVIVHLSPDLRDKHRQQIRDALTAVGLFGGLGARSRRGFGSLTLLKLEADGEVRAGPPADPPALRQDLQRLLSKARNAECYPRYTAFSNHSQILAVSDTAWKPLEALEKLGEEFLSYRSWGRLDRSTGRYMTSLRQPAEQNFREDHDLIADFLEGQAKPKEPPRRIAFGLPHNYFFSTSHQNVEVTGAFHSRRASPLIFHVHQGEQGAVTLLVIFLPAVFLPEQEKIKITPLSRPKESVEVQQRQATELWKPIEDFLKRLEDRPKYLNSPAQRLWP